MTESKRRAIVSSLVFERPGDTVRPHVERGFVTSFVLFVWRPLWSRRLELSLLVVPLVLVAWAHNVFGVVGSIVCSLIVAGLLCNNWSWSRLSQVLHTQFVRRSFDRACRYGLVVSPTDRTPRVLSCRQTPAGSVLRVQMPPGLSTQPLCDASEVLASNLAVQSVTIERDRRRADLATVQIVRHDPLEDPTPVAWPQLSALRLSVWEPIPVGFDEQGEVVSLRLPEKMVLVGAETGAGKSVSVSMLCATAALDPDCRLVLFDGKQVELAFWRDCADQVIGPSLPDAVDALEKLRVEMDRRYGLLLSSGRRKIERGDPDMALTVVVIDELAFYFTMGERKQCQEFERLFRDLVARGRAAGIVVVGATQKPAHDIIPTSVRDLFAVRWALRCATSQASDTVLGSGWSSRGFNASEFEQSTRGLGFLLHEGQTPVRLRSYYLSDDDLRALAERGAWLRKQWACQEFCVSSGIVS